MTRTFWLTLVTVVLTASLAADDGSARISGPVLGYVLDADSAEVRPIFGIPGAATLGPALDLGAEVHSAAAAQQAGYVLAVVGPDRRVVLYHTSAGGPSAVVVADAPPGPERIVLSPNGSAAALLYREQILVLTGLPAAAAVNSAINLTELPAAFTAWALSDDGGAILVSTRVGEGESVYLLDAAGNLRSLLRTGRTAAAAFFHGGSDVVVADGLSNTVHWIRDAAGAATVVPLGSEQEGILAPVALGVSRDNRRVFVANGGSGSVVALDLAGGAPGLVTCDCALTRFDQLQGNAVFRLTDPSGDPMWLLDGDAPEARVVFVPPERAGAELVPARGGRK